MIKDVFLTENYFPDHIEYHVVDENYEGPILPYEIRKPKVFIFTFDQFEAERNFSIACYTLEEALYTFVNMYKDVEIFKVMVRE